MDQAFHDLIKKTKDGAVGKLRYNNTSHVIFIPQQQFITIRRDKLGEFLEGYCSLVFKGEGMYSIAEMNERDMPVISLMTFQFNKVSIGDDEMFNDIFLAELIFAWQKGCTECLLLSETHEELTCIVLESDRSWQEGDSSFYQVKLQFPLCKTESSNIAKIREKAIYTLRRKNTMRLLQVTPEHDWDKIIDANAHTDPLLLYKSIKAPNRPKMTLSKIYSEITEDDLSKGIVNTYTLDQIFNPRSHTFVTQGLVAQDIFGSETNPDKDDPLFWLPLILSVNYSNSITLQKDEEP